MGKKDEQLGMSFGTANNRLRKAILFSLVQKLNEDKCFRCEKIIASVDDLSIEHKEPWQSANNPVESFFSLDNISFSHLSCNVKASVQNYKRWEGHTKQTHEQKIKKQRLYQKRKYDAMTSEERREYNLYMKEYMRKYRSRVA